MQGFDTLTPPFDRLTHDEAEALKRRADIGYFRPSEVIVAQGQRSDFLHVLLKGSVEVRSGASLLAVLGTGDTFDARAVVHGDAGEDFVAIEETLCLLLPREAILELVRSNRSFGAFFYAEVSQKLDALSARPGGDLSESVFAARVRDVRHCPAAFLDGTATLREAAERMYEADIDAVFVEDGERIGVVTGLKLTRATMIQGLPAETPVRDIAQFPVVAIDADSRVVDALLIMTRGNKRRIAVRSEGRFTGLLRDIDILGLFAGNSQLIPGRIARATSLDDLVLAARDIEEQVARLHDRGVKVDAIAGITSDLNQRLHARLFAILAPEPIQAAGCLFLMGSEGRGEQIVRTDQDNGLLLAAPVPARLLNAFRADFTQALERCGFPPCPGDIMVRNPIWSQPLDGFLRQLRDWIQAGSPDASMRLAMFADAAPVAGNRDLVDRARTALVEMMRGETRLLAQLASLTDLGSGTQIGLVGNVLSSLGIRSDKADLKRDGIFPIVHGVRVLAIEHAVLPGSTAQRIDALAACGALDRAFGRELVGALQVFMSLRVRAQLEAARRRRADETVVDSASMTTIERDVLRDALRIVGRFRTLIGVRYNLGAI